MQKCITVAAITSAMLCGLGCGLHRPPKQIPFEMPIYPIDPKLEKELDSWKPDAANATPAPKAYSTKDMVIEGIWRKRAGRGSILLQITSEDGRYTITYTRLVDVVPPGGWTLRRTGKYEAGILTLNRPISVRYAICQKLYSVRIDKREMLLSPTDVKNFMRQGANGEVNLWRVAFERVPSDSD